MEIALPIVNLGTILPQLIVVTFAVAALLIDAFYRNVLSVFIVSFLGLLLALCAVYSQYGVAVPYEESMVAINGYTVFFNAIFILVAAATMFISLGYVDLTGVDGGKYYPLEEAAALPEQLTYSPAGVSIPEVRELWDMPFWLLVLLMLKGSEWALRKRWKTV